LDNSSNASVGAIAYTIRLRKPDRTPPSGFASAADQSGPATSLVFAAESGFVEAQLCGRNASDMGVARSGVAFVQGKFALGTALVGGIFRCRRIDLPELSHAGRVAAALCCAA
jgi:hypothetical protein